MASRTSRKEWVRGLPSAFGVGRNDRKRVHSASERSVGYVFLIEESVQNYPNPHPYQTGSKSYRHLTQPFIVGLFDGLRANTVTTNLPECTTAQLHCPIGVRDDLDAQRPVCVVSVFGCVEVKTLARLEGVALKQRFSVAFELRPMFVMAGEFS